MDKPKPMTRRERRRRQNKKQTEENAGNKQNVVANKDAKIKARKVQSLSRVVRRDTFTVSKTRGSKDGPSSDDATKTFDVGKAEGNLIVLSDPDDSKNLTHTIRKGSTSTESKNLTYQLEKDSGSGTKSKNLTYELEGKPPDEKRHPPVPAPRMRKPSSSKDSERVSSDTDEDVLEIELDDSKEKQENASETKVQLINANHSGSETDDSGEAVVVPKPMPRKSSAKPEDAPREPESPKKSQFPEQMERGDAKSEEDLKFDESDESAAVVSEKQGKRVALVAKNTEMDNSNSDDNSRPKSRRARRLTVTELLERKNKKKSASKMFSTMMRLERAKIPKISSILRELKEDVSKDGRSEQFTEEDKIDFQMDSPRIPESDHFGKIYVQNKNGFYVRTREEVFRRNSLDGFGDEGNMEDSTIRTAVLFHKYWSRLMICFHGVLAGFAFCHVVSVTAIMMYQQYEPKAFVAVYSYLALKIHFIFYTLIALCIVSCLDRLDVGHFSRKHYECAGKLPSMWIIIGLYLVSFVLTFANHKTESRFDAYQFGAQTEETLWDPAVHANLDSILMTWYRVMWPRDILVLVAWLLISLTQYTDFLYLHLVNTIKYTEVRSEADANQKSKSFYLQ